MPTKLRLDSYGSAAQAGNQFAVEDLTCFVVADRDLTTPPATPVEGVHYIAATGSTGAWSGGDGKLWTSWGGTWVALALWEGVHLWIADEDVLRVHNGSTLVSPSTAAASDTQPIARGGSGATTAVGALDAFSVKATDVTSGAPDNGNIAGATGDLVFITGTTTITALGTAAAGVERTVKFAGILTLTHNATSLILPDAANITTAAGDVAVFRSLGSGNWLCVAYDQITLTGDVTASGKRSLAATLAANLKTAVITVMFDGGGAALTTGIKADIEVPFACTITRATVLADQSGSIVIDVWKDTYANYPPTVADTITASAKPTLSSATKAQDATLTGWTTAIAAGDTLRFNIDSVSTCQRVVLALRVTKT